MSEPAPAWELPNQCPARYYSYGAYRHCELPPDHSGDHFHSDGGWEGSQLEWSEVVKSAEFHRKAPTVYIAGAMTGKKDWNFPAFHKAAEKLRGIGYTVINPAEEFSGNTELPREFYMQRAIQNVLRSDIIFTLRGWGKSEGARLEVDVAKAVGKEVKSCP